MQCVKCGANNRTLAKFCEECGTAFALSCPQCGAPVFVGKKFCGDCGASLFSLPLASAQLSSTNTQTRRLPDSTPSPASYTPAHLASRILSGKAALEGERKIITVLFADIKGSMDILESLDPEESKRLLDPCIQRMMDAVHRAEGTVSRVLGDGIMALFGAPLALEDHPHHALYAALRMQETVRRYAKEVQQRYDLELQIRIGINTGEVVVGAIGNDLFMEYTPVGHAVGIAARMETQAAPGTTLVTAATYQLTQHAFRFSFRGSTKIKGAAEPVAMYELLGVDLSRSRLTARMAYGLSPFLGRARELDQLDEFATRAAAGRGQVITLTGEAGIGKSRLIEELKTRLRERDFILIEGEGFAYGKTRAYLPLIDMLKRYCGIGDQDPSVVYRDKLQATLTGVHPSLAPFVPIFLDLLGVEVNDPSVATLSAEAKLQQVLNGVKRLIALQCRLQPVAFIIEDIHWLDTRSIVFLHALTASLTTLPVFLLCSSRPPDQPYPWEEHSFAHSMQLEPLSQAVTASLFTVLTKKSTTGTSLASVVCQRSGGNPLFLEEIVHTLHETGALVARTTAPASLTSPMNSTDWTLPPTVQGVLASRLDRLPPLAKGVLQTASVIGQETPYALLIQVSALPDSHFAQALQLLQARELLYEAELYPDSVYAFKHALIQEVAYHGLLLEHRAKLHERVGNAMGTLYADKLPEYAGLLAYHYHRSANTAKALQYLDLAGRRATALYADADAQYFWEECLRLLATQPRTAERDRREVRIRLHLINVLSHQHNDDAPARAQFAAAEAVCHQLGDSHLLTELHATLAVTYILWGRPRLGLTHARTAKEIADTLQHGRLQAITAGPLAHLLWIAGSFRDALHVAEEGLTLVQQHGLAQEPIGFIIHPHDHCMAIAGASKGLLGMAEQGVTDLRQAAALTQSHGNRMSQAVVHWGLSLVFDLYGNHAQAQQETTQAVKIMKEVSPTTGLLLVGSLHEYLTASIAHSSSETQMTDPHDMFAKPTLAKLVRTWREKLAFCEFAGVWLAEIAAQSGNLDTAHILAREALAKAEESESRWFLCVAHLTLGRLLASMAGETPPEAEIHLRTAHELAVKMQSLPLVAYAAVELAELLAKSRNASTQAEATQYFQQATELGKHLKIQPLLDRDHSIQEKPHLH